MGGNYKDVENRLLSAVYLRFSLPAAMPAALAKQVKKADREAAFFEAIHLAGFEDGEARKFELVSARTARTGVQICRYRPRP